MTLLLIAQKIWRYKLVTVPIVCCVLVGAFYVIAIKADLYEASSSYILVTPPAPPTPDEIARDPKLGVGTDNPYTRYSDQSIVVQVLASRLSGDDARLELARRGADPRYTVAPSSEFGFSAPIVAVTGAGATPAGAIKTADVVGAEVKRELDRMQKAHGVAPRYRIDAQQVVGAHDAKLKASGKLRAGVAVLALGTVMLFIVVSLLDGLAALRKEFAKVRAGNGTADNVAGGPHPVRDLPPDAAAAGNGAARSAWDEDVPAPKPWPASASK